MKQFLTLIIFFSIPFFGLSQDTSIRLKKIGLTVSLPWINSYYYYDYHLQKSVSKSGFIGLGASIFCKSGKNKFSLNGGFTGDLPVPFGPFDYGKEGTRTNILSNYWEALYHKKLFDRVNMIAGLNYITYRLSFTCYVDSLPSYSIFDKTLGLTIGSEYLFSKNSSIALLYKPTIICFDQKQYRHLISFDFRFDINLWKHE